jgi:C4-dicarboxylate transporter/malic acid transport protein
MRTVFGSAFSAAIGNVGPAWFTSVMGTGILAISLAVAPLHAPALRYPAIGLFVVAVVMFVTFAALWCLQIVGSRQALRASLADAGKAQAWGAPPMACFTVAVGLLKVGTMIAPAATCVAIAQVLWIAGVLLSLFSSFYVPFLMFTLHELVPERAYGSWLLPVVPPIVASVPAALLLASWPVALRSSMLGIAYALLGLGAALAAIIIVVFYTRLLFQKLPEAAFIPTMWLVVGPLGQSVAGIIALGAAATGVWPQYAHGLLVAGLAYGMMVWGFGVYWLSMAIVATLRAALRKLPFNLGWWAFTFPVGTLTSGSFALYGATGAVLFGAVGLALLALLATMWVLVAAHTTRLAIASVTPEPVRECGARCSASRILERVEPLARAQYHGVAALRPLHEGAHRLEERFT